MRRTQEKFLEAMQERVPRAKFGTFGAEKAQFNGLDQKFTKDDRVHHEREDVM